jgi:hypothetical protein
VAPEAAQARRELLSQLSTSRLKPTAIGTTLDELLDLYLGGLDADGRLSAKTRFDYRHYADRYVPPHLGRRHLRDVSAEVLLAWQRYERRTGTGGSVPSAEDSV